MLELQKFTTFEEFAGTVRCAGFLPGGFPWANSAEFSVFGLATEGVQWHSGIADLDPWEWRIRVLTDCDDIAYGKVFAAKSGYITREWYPTFIAARRAARSIDEAWEYGLLSRPAKRIYDALRDVPALSSFDLRVEAGLKGEKKSVYERALNELQAKLYITYCGEAQKLSSAGEPYGWPGAVYCTSENFFPGVEWEAEMLDPEDAAERIRERVLEICPDVGRKEMKEIVGI